MLLLLALTLLLLLPFSAFYAAGYVTPANTNLGLQRGCFSISAGSAPIHRAFPPGWYLERHLAPVRWWPYADFSRPYWSMLVPLWSLALPPLALGLWLRRRRRYPGECPRCAYPSRDLPASAPCPECGARR